jgi:hypothetical protein
MLSYSLLLWDNLNVIVAYWNILWNHVSESDTSQEQNCSLTVTELNSATTNPDPWTNIGSSTYNTWWPIYILQS